MFLGIKLYIHFASNLREISIVKDLKATSSMLIDKVLDGVIMLIPSIGLQLGMRDSAVFVKSSGKSF